MSLQFFLGCHRPHWLASSKRPLFVSHRQLCKRKTLPRASCDWALDSGGFSELSMFGRWVTTPAEYAASVRRYQQQIGRLQFASQQDWMCEPFMIAKTGLSVAEHQRRTVENFLELRRLAPWMPVLQGWTVGEYLEHADMFRAAGVDLAACPRVGIGSVCRRQSSTRISHLFILLEMLGCKLHGFGVKSAAIAAAGGWMHSADSMAWSYAARKEKRAGKDVDPNAFATAEAWYADRVAPVLAEGFNSLGMANGARVRKAPIVQFAPALPRVAAVQQELFAA